ncbi:hypothetical protein J6590_086122 [Homalodisca vitripennis]|nr:hypothetical protein J6590_086122 [Homalodisca vitripennis]
MESKEEVTQIKPNFLADMDMLRIKKGNTAVDEIEKKCRRQTTLAKKRLEDD